jgi:LysM repeat protein
MRKNFRHIVLVSILLCLILFGSSGGAEEQNSNKTAAVANLEFVNTDLRQVFCYLAQAGGFQTLLDPGVQRVVSIAFTSKVPARDAAIALANSSGLKFQWSGDLSTLYIGNSNLSNSSLRNKENRIITLKYVNPAVAVEALTAVIPKNRITINSSDAKNNQLKISANELEFQNISEIIQNLDRILPQLTIAIRIIELPEKYLKELIPNLIQAPTSMGAYLLTDNQLQLMENHNQFSSLYQGEIPVSERQVGQLTLEDQVPKAPENSPDGAANYRVENLAVGINYSVAFGPGQGTKLTLKVRAKTQTITNTNPPKNATGYTPVPGVRELTSIVPWEAGQKILFTGVLQRSEFQGLLNIPYKFPVINDLFLGKNILQPAQNSATQTILIMIPQIKGAANPTVTARPTGSRTGTALTGSNGSSESDFTNIPGAAEKKEPITLGSPTPIPISPTQAIQPGSTISAFQPTPTLRRGSTRTTIQPTVIPERLVFFGGVTRIEYIVKKGDTLTQLAAKFGVTVDAISAENNLESPGTIGIGMKLQITVNTDRVYTIKPKETLWRIAKRYGVSVEELKDINGIADIEKVEAGQKIVLPVSVFDIKNPRF